MAFSCTNKSHEKKNFVLVAEDYCVRDPSERRNASGVEECGPCRLHCDKRGLPEWQYSNTLKGRLPFGY